LPAVGRVSAGRLWDATADLVGAVA
jgi:hypothetical protein